jgi:hypothetical protein
MTNSMSRKEYLTALEVMDQYDLDEEETARALNRINTRAKEAPFNAYSASHPICAEIVRTRVPLKPAWYEPQISELNQVWGMF